MQAATELYGKVFKPTIHFCEIYAFEDLPRAPSRRCTRTCPDGFIPIVRVAKFLNMPEAVMRLWSRRAAG